MLEVNEFKNTDTHTKHFYSEYIKNFRFMKHGEVDVKVNLVFCKIIIIALYLSICGISSNYIVSVFFFDESLGFPIYFKHAISGVGFWIWFASMGFISTSIRIILKKIYNYAYLSPIRSADRIERLLYAVKQIPELKQVVSQRIRERGFISEMDYNNLCIDKICRDIGY